MCFNVNFRLLKTIYVHLSVCTEIKFAKNMSTGSRVVRCGTAGGRADAQDEANTRFSQFRERAQKELRCQV